MINKPRIVEKRVEPSQAFSDRPVLVLLVAGLLLALVMLIFAHTGVFRS